MRADGYTNVEGVDWCQTLVTQCNTENSTIPHHALSVLDLESQYEESSIDYIIDKALLDSILCGANSTQNAYTYLMQCKKALKPGGKLIVVSYGPFEKRREHLKDRQTLGFQYEESKIDKPQAAGVTPQGAGIDANHYIYVLTK